MNRNRSADIKLFESIVCLHQDKLFRFAFMRIGVREVAEDIMQEVFLRLFRLMNDGKEIQNPEHYLIRSMHNACTDYHRKRKVTDVDIEEISDLPAEQDSDRDITEEYLRIRRILRGLPPEQEEIIRLKCYDELKFTEIAELLDIPETTVKSRFRYAITRIRKTLNICHSYER